MNEKKMEIIIGEEIPNGRKELRRHKCNEKTVQTIG